MPAWIIKLFPYAAVGFNAWMKARAEAKAAAQAISDAASDDEVVRLQNLANARYEDAADRGLIDLEKR